MKVIPKIKSAGIVEQTAGKELLLYNTKNHKAFCLNETLTTVYQACDGKTPVAELTASFNKKFSTGINDDFILLALQELKNSELLETEAVFPANDAVSRRQALLSYALPLAMLPLLTILIAPESARASSVCPGTIPSRGTFTIPDNGGGTSSCFTSANDRLCASCRVNAAACLDDSCTTIVCTCR